MGAPANPGVATLQTAETPLSAPYAKPRPRGLLRVLLRIPPLLYRADRLAQRLGPRLLLLTTVGRRTGRRRTIGLNYAIDGETVYVISGFGPTDWLRNLVADPEVAVQIGNARWRGLARLVRDPAEQQRARRLFRRRASSQGPPQVLRGLLGKLGLDYEAELRTLDRPDLAFPVVAIRPTSGRSI